VSWQGRLNTQAMTSLRSIESETSICEEPPTSSPATGPVAPKACVAASEPAPPPPTLSGEEEPERPRHRRLPLVARIGVFLVGWLLILVGIAGLVLPGIQGVLTILVGAALLSLVSEIIYELLRKSMRPWPRAWERVERFRDRAHDRLHRWFHRKENLED
jgi:hypothetical protein